jgi:TonB family protein
MIAFVLAHMIAAAADAACGADSPAHVTLPPVFSAPDGPNIHTTNRRVRFLIDIGSDGRERRVGMVESSGDATVDAAALAAVHNMRFAPSLQNCISATSVAPESFNVSLITLAQPGAVASAPVTPICGDPFVQITGMDVPDKRQAPGTADIDVGLSASAKVTSAVLAKSSGNKTTDAVAIASAKSGEFQFVTEPGCAPKPTTYRLELTYH